MTSFRRRPPNWAWQGRRKSNPASQPPALKGLKGLALARLPLALKGGQPLAQKGQPQPLPPKGGAASSLKGLLRDELQAAMPKVKYRSKKAESRRRLVP